MRTDRRLILNAQVCRDALKRGKIKDGIQANAYLWMILQPYLSMDALAIAMLTPEQAQLMTDIAKDYPAIITRLEGKHLVNKEVSNKIPAQLMRLYISTSNLSLSCYRKLSINSRHPAPCCCQS